MARGIVYSNERLHTLFEPRSIALVGASDKSTWSLMIHVGLTQGGFDGNVYYINPRNLTVHGRPAVARLTEIGEPVDLCYIMVGTDAVLCMMELPADETPQSRFLMNILAGIGQALEQAPLPAFLLSLASNDVKEAGRAFLDKTHIPFISGGIRILIPALGKLMDWTERYRVYQAKGSEEPSGTTVGMTLPEPAVGSWSEYQARTFLEQHNIPVIPATLATSAEQAAEAARALGFPVALKIASPDIVHKSNIGGVKLGLQNEEEVRSAFAQVMSSVKAVTPALRIEGVLVSPMRSGGVELLVGITRDATWGQVLAVGMGGIWVEALKDSSLRVLPITPDDVQAMLAELQGAKLLYGARGSKPADMHALVEVIYRVAELAQALKIDLEALEINPLRVDGSQIEALDAVITWQSAQ